MSFSFAGPAALAIILMFTVHKSAPAQGLQGIQTPSHNIFCAVEGPYQNGGAPDLRCELAKISSRSPPRPSLCEGDWGHGFAVGQNAKIGERICISDTIRDPFYPILSYERTWRRAGFTCKSQRTGLTCVNPSGHGFMLSRAIQKLF